MGKEGVSRSLIEKTEGNVALILTRPRPVSPWSLSEGDNQVGKSSNLTARHVLTKGPVVDRSPKNADCPAWESSWQMSPPGVPGTH